MVETSIEKERVYSREVILKNTRGDMKHLSSILSDLAELSVEGLIDYIEDAKDMDDLYNKFCTSLNKHLLYPTVLGFRDTESYSRFELTNYNEKLFLYCYKCKNVIND